jgi:hypothetical protein
MGKDQIFLGNSNESGIQKIGGARGRIAQCKPAYLWQIRLQERRAWGTRSVGGIRAQRYGINSKSKWWKGQIFLGNSDESGI